MAIAREEERRRIARDLHDHVGSALAAVLLQCKMLEAARNLGDAREHAARLASTVLGTLAGLREVAHALRPTALTELGLAASVRRMAGGLPGVRVAVEVNLAGARIPTPVQLAMFRIIEETLGNVARHAEAAHVRLECRVGDGTLEATIIDDGRGFDVRAVRAGIGLAGMRERATLVGGTLAVVSVPGRGTTVSVRIPLS